MCNWPVVQSLRYGRDRLTAERARGNVLDRGEPRGRFEATLSQCGHDIGIETVPRCYGMFSGEEPAAQRIEAIRIDHILPDMGRSPSPQMLTHCSEGPIHVVVNRFRIRPSDNFRDGFGRHFLYHVQLDGHTFFGSE